MYYFYILYSNKLGKYYIGHTGDDLLQRVRRHNTNHRGFTGGNGDWEIVHQEPYMDKSGAYGREREVKGWKSRKRVEELVGASRLKTGGS